MSVKKLSADVDVLNNIGEQTCASLFNMAKYATYTSTDQIKFGQEFTSIAKFCDKWANYKTKLFIIQGWCGAPGKGSYRKITLNRLAQDWYLSAVARGNEYVVNKVEENYR